MFGEWLGDEEVEESSCDVIIRVIFLCSKDVVGVVDKFFYVIGFVVYCKCICELEVENRVQGHYG